MAAILSAEHLSKSYTLKKLLTDVTIYIGEHDRIGVVGVNGTGKSTLLKLLAGMEKPDGGVVMRKNGLRVSYLPQMPDYSVARTAVQQVLYDAPKDVGAPDEYEAKSLLSQFGISDFDADVRTLSGGQKQRVGIARALATEPAILLCDEATSALDPKTTESILGLLKRINKKMGVTILLITHQMQVIQMICNKVAVMGNGQIVEQGTVLDVFSQPHAPVTQEFVRTVINDQIPKSILDLLQTETRHYVIDRLKFIGASVKKPVISEICQIAGVEVNILGATVQEFGESIMCIFILQMFGSDDKLLQAEAQIDATGVLRERVVFD